jgi:hypothetical protein
VKRRTVADVMTAKVVTVTAKTPFKDIAETLIAGGISAVPVVDDDGHVVGMVSEADLLRKEEFREQFYREGYQPPLRARLRHPKGRQKAAGDIAAEVREDILDRGLWVDTSGVVVQVRQGVVTLSGRMDRKTETAIAVRMTGRVNGVVDVIDELTWKHDDSTWEAQVAMLVREALCTLGDGRFATLPRTSALHRGRSVARPTFPSPGGKEKPSWQALATSDVASPITACDSV